MWKKTKLERKLIDIQKKIKLVRLESIKWAPRIKAVRFVLYAASREIGFLRKLSPTRAEESENV